jgi:hypothetical protein
MMSLTTVLSDDIVKFPSDVWRSRLTIPLLPYATAQILSANPSEQAVREHGFRARGCHWLIAHRLQPWPEEVPQLREEDPAASTVRKV